MVEGNSLHGSDNVSESNIVNVYDERYLHGYRDDLSGYETARCAAIKDLIIHILEINSTNLKILDYGCGSGAHVKLWERAFNEPDLYFCDISPVALDKLKEKHPRYSENVSIINGDKTDFKDQQFDIIVSIEVMEHVLNLDAYLDEIYRLLKDGGLFIWTTPCSNPNSIEYIFSRITNQIETTYEDYIRWSWEDPTHIRRLDSEQATNALINVGFFEPQIRFRSHFFSFICTKLFVGPLRKYSHHFIILDWKLFKHFKNGASMVGVAKRGR